MVSIIHVLIVKCQDKFDKENPTSDPKTSLCALVLKEEHMLLFCIYFWSLTLISLSVFLYLRPRCSLIYVYLFFVVVFLPVNIVWGQKQVLETITTPFMKIFSESVKQPRWVTAKGVIQSPDEKETQSSLLPQPSVMPLPFSLSDKMGERLCHCGFPPVQNKLKFCYLSALVTSTQTKSIPATSGTSEET